MARIVSELIYKLIADEADLVKGLKAAEKKLDETSKKFKDTGKALTLGLTAPIVAAGTAMVKLASDAGESLNAVNVVFKDSGKTIEEWGKTAATQAGISAQEFYQLSATIGAGLINAGASEKEAAKNTIELTKRASDMASIFNTSVDDAMVALEAGLRGENEQLRKFAVSLDDATVSARAVSMGMVDANGDITAYGKSQARLAIIMEQSARFEGDFAKTSGELAGSIRVTTSQVKDQAAELGTQLLPVVLNVVKGLQGAVSWFSALSDEQKKAILITAGVAAAIGPVLIGIGSLITAVNTVSTAMAALGAASGPVGLAILAIGALVAGIVALNGVMAEQKKVQDQLDFASVAKDIGLTVEKVSDLEKDLFFLLPTLNQIGQGTGDIAEYTTDWSTTVDQIAKKYGITRDQALKVLSASKSITDQQKATVKQLEDSLKITDDITTSELMQAAIKENWSKKIREDQAKQYQKELQDGINAAKAEQDAADKKKKNAQDRIDLINQTIAADKTERDALLASIQMVKEAKGQADVVEKDRLAALAKLNADLAAMDQKAADEQLTAAEAQAQAEEDLLRQLAMTDAEIEAQKTANAKAESDKRSAEQKKAFDDTINYAEFASKAIFGFAEQLTKNESMELDNRAIRDKEAINNSTKTEEEKAEAIKKLEQNLAIEKAKIAQKTAIYQKAQAIVGIAIDTAKAIAANLANPFFATAIGIAGAAQAAAVLAQPLPEIPSFANGGSFMVPQGFNNDSFPLPAAMVQSGERVTVETPEQQRQGKAIFQIGTVIASPDGYRELERQLQKYGTVEKLRRGK